MRRYQFWQSRANCISERKRDRRTIRVDPTTFVTPSATSCTIIAVKSRGVPSQLPVFDFALPDKIGKRCAQTDVLGS